MLLVGPTASGKTPLGRLLEKRGFRGTRCVHFDFGECLREAASWESGGPLDQDELAVIRSSLETGALLEGRDFPIAGKLIRRLIDERALGPRDLLVLNGFPRTPEQAVFVEKWAVVRTVVNLEADEQTILERISRDPAGDRLGRVDDGPGDVLARLDIYRNRTRPLLEHYRARGARVITVEVLPQMTAADVLGLIGG